jgi:hypothetical protein
MFTERRRGVPPRVFRFVTAFTGENCFSGYECAEWPARRRVRAPSVRRRRDRRKPVYATPLRLLTKCDLPSVAQRLR